jgi:hypothetical protein
MWRATSLNQEVAEQTIVAQSDQKSVDNELRRGLDDLKDQRSALILVSASGILLTKLQLYAVALLGSKPRQSCS